MGYERFAHYLQVGFQVYRTNERLQNNHRELRRLQNLLENSTKDDEKAQLRGELQYVDREQFRLRSLLNQQLMLSP
jgi:succinate dehydrogenase/fumarate reductase flavoprotein subunit